MKKDGVRLSRRSLLSTAAATAAAGAAAPAMGQEAPGQAQAQAPPPRGVTPPSAEQRAAETAPPREARVVGRTGSDYMVDVIKSLDLDYITTNPGSSFRAIHESLINYGGNRQPELLTCLHEEIAVAMCHGYAKAAGKPMGALLHGVVGLTHGSMAIYNAWCDRTPIVMISGNTIDAMARHGATEWNHSTQTDGAIVRDITKWSDQPVSLRGFGESLVRAYGLAVTPPCAPVLVTADKSMQEAPAPDGLPPVRVTRPRPPAADLGALREAARLLARAERPLIIADQLVRDQAGMDALVALAETLQAPVIDRLGRLNMPNTHPLCVSVLYNQSPRATQLAREADVILGLEVWDMWGSLYSEGGAERAITAPGVKIITISTNDLHVTPNVQDFQRYNYADLAITADAQTCLPQLVEEVRRAGGSASGRAARARALAEANRLERAASRRDASYGWDASPISVARLAAELWAKVKDADWVMASDTLFKSRWPQRLWRFEKQHQYLGGSGGQGIGYGGPAAIGAALAHRAQGRLVIGFVGDGDLLYCPQALWTAAHHRIPLLMVVHNNRAYHQEVMHIQRMANRHARGIDRAHIGTTIDNPAIDFAKVAAGMGVWAEGPIADPAALGPAIGRALEVVRRGEPALLDVVCEPR
ncbi:MAG: thiamine pyrophosphate-binding protein [Hyphomonadaceae bacterium]|nr:thiamine pyrophosphate-binding protein [Hyphomonadaceae bacterium]